MRVCDKRLELRLPEKEKHAVEALARQHNTTVSHLLRRALRSYAGMPDALNAESRAAVAGLRRRINAIEHRIGVGDNVGVAADIRQARHDAQALMGR